jgi:hypothetical protein
LKTVSIINDDFKLMLKNAEWFTKSIAKDNVHAVGNPDPTGYYSSHEYAKKIIEKGVRHDGYPDEMHGYSFNSNRIKLRGDNIEAHNEIIKRHENLINDFKTEYAMKNNALFTLYPPNGFISWHNNANAAAYNVILTWSENGDGYFEYFDINKKEYIRVQDQPGWQCKVSYFGHYGEKDKLVYHTARTNCWRLTLSFIFDLSSASQFAQEMFIEDISSE